MLESLCAVMISGFIFPSGDRSSIFTDFIGHLMLVVLNEPISYLLLGGEKIR